MTCLPVISRARYSLRARFTNKKTLARTTNIFFSWGSTFYRLKERKTESICIFMKYLYWTSVKIFSYHTKLNLIILIFYGLKNKSKNAMHIF